MSSADLAKMLGVTYQQLLAYEIGHNKLTAGGLYLASVALDVPVSFFFDEMPEALLACDTNSNVSQRHTDEILHVFSVKNIKTVEAEIRSIIDVYYLIDNQPVRRGILDLMKVIGKKF